MGLFDAIDTAATGLSAERLRMDVTAENLANADTTRTVEGGPYKRKSVVLSSIDGGGAGSFGAALNNAMGQPSGVQVAGIVEDTSPPRMMYDPGHPDANAEGYVAMPNVEPVGEMVDLIAAQRAYEANVTAMQTAKQMFTKTLDILR